MNRVEFDQPINSSVNNIQNRQIEYFPEPPKHNHYRNNTGKYKHSNEINADCGNSRLGITKLIQQLRNNTSKPSI